MSNDKMSPELQIAIRRSPDYTAPSAELIALRAEVAAWRRAVRWHPSKSKSSYDAESLELYIAVDDSVCSDWRWLGNACKSSVDGMWIASADRTQFRNLPDRNTACAKVCELLGIPVVLPAGGE